MKNILILTVAGLFLAACGSQSGVNSPAGNGISNAPNKNAAPTPVATPAVNSNTNANKAADNTAKPDASGPKRVSFQKGATEGSETVTLAPGATAQFILGATGAQTLFINSDSKDLTYRTVRGILGEMIRADDGTYSAETKGNNGNKGDIVFEVKNPTSKEIRAKLRIALEDFAD